MGRVCQGVPGNPATTAANGRGFSATTGVAAEGTLFQSGRTPSLGERHAVAAGSQGRYGVGRTTGPEHQPEQGLVGRETGVAARLPRRRSPMELLSESS